MLAISSLGFIFIVFAIIFMAAIVALARQHISLAAALALLFIGLVLVEQRVGDFVEKMPENVKGFFADRALWASLGAVLNRQEMSLIIATAIIAPMIVLVYLALGRK